MTVKLRTVGIAVLLALVLAAAGAGLVVYSGIYNISATAQHTKPVFQLLEYAMRRSVKLRTDSITVPDLSDRQRILRGAGHYNSHCLQCHGAPGVSPHALAFGMTPAPVNLVSTAREWLAADIYWVIKHGIKMSGMPAWEYQMSDQDIWDIVAFVEMTPTLSPKEYAALSNESAEQHANRQKHTRKPSMAAAPPPSAPASLPPSVPASIRQQGALLGDAKAGRRAAGQYLCATCHEIPGIVGANRHVGPPLNGIGSRKYIAGIISNNPENMVRWLQNPQQLDPLSAMPDLGVTEKDARDISAYLYTLDDVE
ncbi:MAG: cytochrome C [Burkholderiales bacterium RIFCSPLOWO2_02_FULL_57_36]|nr:MAG: cytochrome C [Burkholderiales bacterium RIFCSPLOWO2_02_FULL_57_36]